jgi:hypothetical protein
MGSDRYNDLTVLVCPANKNALNTSSPVFQQDYCNKIVAAKKRDESILSKTRQIPLSVPPHPTRRSEDILDNIHGV